MVKDITQGLDILEYRPIVYKFKTICLSCLAKFRVSFKTYLHPNFISKRSFVSKLDNKKRNNE